MKKIDIVITAVLRPEIIEGTFESFCKYLFKDKNDYRLFINIDRIGNSTPQHVLDVANKYFNEVYYRTSNDPSFPIAVKWLWKQTLTTPSNFVFHLEDDWQLNREINIQHMIDILNKYDNLACLRLYKHDIPKSKTPIMFGRKYDYKPEGFFIARDSSNQFGLNPVLVKKEFIEEAVHLLKDDLNPEKQMRAVYPWMTKFIMKWKYGIYGNPGDKILVWGKRGKYWRESMGFEKGKMNFVTWQKKEK